MIWVLLAVIVVLVLIVVSLYNKLVRLKNRTDEAWAQIDVQLRRRYDLIPNLVETVKGYAAHERSTLEAVIQARAAAESLSAQGASPAAIGQAEGQLTTALRGLLAVTEAYPDLKANQNFMQLSEELTGTENKISFARQHYNDSVRAVNTAVETIPTSFIAPIAHVGKRDYFELDPTDPSRDPVKVQF
ncbi:MAG TPA: LemA family protein [Mycobacteriales bacterium]|nr:LemA family protein [Mycobacteriales bacterium]